MDSATRRQTIADLLHRTAKRYPNKPGLSCGDTHWTFEEFDAVVDRVAAGLSRMGVGHASRVAVLARNSHSRRPRCGSRCCVRRCSTTRT
jgi:fatty-acyl-CoA synthase